MATATPMRFDRSRTFAVPLGLAWVLLACSHPDATQTPPGGAAKAGAPPALSHQVAGAATTPLHDLNLVRTKIPPVLLAAQKDPYAMPMEPTCEGLAAQVRLLDEALGADLDAPASPTEASLTDQGRAEAGQAAVGAVKGAAESLIPFRGWVRKLSGAERLSRQVSDAVAAGIVRRAYLKGLGEARGCQAPAAPLHRTGAATGGH